MISLSTQRERREEKERKKEKDEDAIGMRRFFCVRSISEREGEGGNWKVEM
jgi:hypothetical protein